MISAMADRAMVKVYAQARDVTGQNRLRADMDVWGRRNDRKRTERGSRRGIPAQWAASASDSIRRAVRPCWSLERGTYFSAAADGGLRGWELLVLGIYPGRIRPGKIGEDHWRIPLTSRSSPVGRSRSQT